MSIAQARRVTLDNGLLVVVQPNPFSSAVSMSLNVAAGACFEVGLEGVASLTGQALTYGTRSQTKREIGETLDFRGAHMAGSAGRHSAGLGARARVEDVDALLELMAECVSAPAFDDDEVRRLVADRVTSLREDDDDPAARVMRAFRQRIYPEAHPYHRAVRGTPEGVASIDGQQLREFHAANYDPSAAMLVAVGGVDADAFIRSARAAFEPWASARDRGGYRAAQPAIADVAAAPAGAPTRIEMPDKAQVDIALGHVGIRRSDPRYHATTLMNMILGQFAMGGRLGFSVREERGMAYYTHSSLTAGLGPGTFLVRAGVQPQHVAPAVEAIEAEIHRLIASGVEQDELEDARMATIRSIPRALESNEGIAGAIHQVEVYDLGYDYLERFPALLQAVDADAVHESARRTLLPDALVSVFAGPLEASDAAP